jgi:hypothetical protein
MVQPSIANLGTWTRLLGFIDNPIWILSLGMVQPSTLDWNSESRYGPAKYSQFGYLDSLGAIHRSPNWDSRSSMSPAKYTQLGF